LNIFSWHGRYAGYQRQPSAIGCDHLATTYQTAVIKNRLHTFRTSASSLRQWRCLPVATRLWSWHPNTSKVQALRGIFSPTTEPQSLIVSQAFPVDNKVSKGDVLNHSIGRGIRSSCSSSHSLPQLFDADIQNSSLESYVFAIQHRHAQGLCIQVS